MTDVTYLLAERTNPHSRIRDNGVRWWGYPDRRGGLDAIRCIAIHTTENDPTPATALNVARWQAHRAPQPSSYHVLVDSDHTVRTVLDSQTAFHVAGFNTPSLGLSFATRAHLWGRYPVWDRLALARAANQARHWADLYGIPRRWITRTQAANGTAGFVRHSTMDPARRTDPGSRFPAEQFFDLIDRPPPGPTPNMMEQLMTAENLADAHEQLADAHEAQAAAAWMPHVAKTRAQAGAEPSTASDFQWAIRIVRGEARLVDAYHAIREHVDG